MAKTEKTDNLVVSALLARANFGKLLERVEHERRSLIIEKRGRPRAVLLSIRDYVRLAAPEPDVLRTIGKESKAKGTDRLSSQQIDGVIRAVRAKKKMKRKCFLFDSSWIRTLSSRLLSNRTDYHEPCCYSRSQDRRGFMCHRLSLRNIRMCYRGRNCRFTKDSVSNSSN